MTERNGPAGSPPGPIGLDEVRADAFRRLAAGVGDHGSAFRNPALGSLDAAGAPTLRTVVLRGFDAGASTLTVHSDLRAAKVAELRADVRAALHVWDPDAQVQVRIAGRATLHAGDARARAEWDGLHAGSRAIYAVAKASGTALADPAGTGRVPEDAAFAHFAVIDIAMLSLEWLHLAPAGHRRARLTFGAAATAAWLVP